MSGSNRKEELKIFATIQAWLDSCLAPRWHGYIWFVLLALGGLGVTAAVAYGIRLLLGIGQ